MVNRKIIICTTIVLAMACACLCSCGSQAVDNAAAAGSDTECLTQISTIKALAAGDYYGSVTVDELLSYGDFGLGTFEAVNGEMIVLDGVCYQALGDGTVIRSSMETMVPFAAVTTLDKDAEITITAATDIDSLKGQLNEEIQKMNPNVFYACRVDGVFSEVDVRSEVAQVEPYKELATVMQTDQREFSYSDIEGTLVCLYCPDYVEGINATGWHIHFISKDGTLGGHVMDVSTVDAVATIDQTDNFAMKLPNGDNFKGLQLTEISEEAINKVEKGN